MKKTEGYFIIKEFDYDGKYNEFVKYTIEKIETPKWCPIK